MVYISKVYTKYGDAGRTQLANGISVPKHSARVEAYGTVDELNATIGWVRLELSRASAPDQVAEFRRTLDDELAKVQQLLFDLGAELATPDVESVERALKLEPRHVEWIERAIDAHNAELEPLRSFVLPGGGPVGTAAHLARTVCRRAERRLWALAELEPVRQPALVWINRLSDYLFVIARAVARAFGHAEVLWQPGLA